MPGFTTGRRPVSTAATGTSARTCIDVSSIRSTRVPSQAIAADPLDQDLSGPYRVGLWLVTILQILPSLSTGGAERTTIDIAAALAGRGHRASSYRAARAADRQTN